MISHTNKTQTFDHSIIDDSNPSSHNTQSYKLKKTISSIAIPLLTGVVGAAGGGATAVAFFGTASVLPIALGALTGAILLIGMRLIACKIYAIATKKKISKPNFDASLNRLINENQPNKDLRPTSEKPKITEAKPLEEIKTEKNFEPAENSTGTSGNENEIASLAQEEIPITTPENNIKTEEGPVIEINKVALPVITGNTIKTDEQPTKEIKKIDPPAVPKKLTAFEQMKEDVEKTAWNNKSKDGNNVLSIWLKILQPDPSFAPLKIKSWKQIEDKQDSKTYKIEFEKVNRAYIDNSVTLTLPTILTLKFSEDKEGKKVIDFPKEQCGLKLGRFSPTGYLQKIGCLNSTLFVTGGKKYAFATASVSIDQTLEILNRVKWS